MRKLTAVFALLFVLASPSLAQDTTSRVIAEALKPSPLEANLERLTDQIGGRVPGTPAMQKAVRWGIDAFKAADLASQLTQMGALMDVILTPAALKFIAPTGGPLGPRRPVLGRVPHRRRSAHAVVPRDPRRRAQPQPAALPPR